MSKTAFGEFCEAFYQIIKPEVGLGGLQACNWCQSEDGLPNFALWDHPFSLSPYVLGWKNLRNIYLYIHPPKL